MMRTGARLFLSVIWAISVIAPAQAQYATSENGGRQPAPDQFPDSLHVAPHPSLYTDPRSLAYLSLDDEPAVPLFEADPSTDDSFRELIAPPGIDPEPLQETQYPFDDSAARDFDPQGAMTPPPVWTPPPVMPSPPPTPQVSPAEGGFYWQDRSLVTTVLPGFNDDLGITTFDFRASLLNNRWPMLKFTPRFSWHLLQGPSAPDLPAQLYDAAIDVTAYFPVTSRWTGLLNVAPSIYSDFNNTGSDAFRITGKAMAFYQWSDKLKLTGGIIYLDREDIIALPATGLIWTPDGETQLEIVFPKPKLSHRYYHDGNRDRWIYLAGEFGGGSWAIERANGTSDVVSLRDYRLIVGWEQIEMNRSRLLFEAGYVFGRRIQYKSDIGNTDQSSTVMFRGGIIF